MDKIHFRAVIEVLGKPKEHVETAIKNYLEKMKSDELFEVTNEEIAELKKQDQEELWAAFAELDIKTERIDHIIKFCFEYMPSMIEIIEPKEFQLSDVNISKFLNDLQARLHHVDMLAKHTKMENDHLKRNAGSLLKNYIQVLLSKSNLTGDQLSKLTGIEKSRLEDFLDQLIDEGKIDLKEDIYFIKQIVTKNES